MKLLAFDTSTEYCSAALFCDGVLASRQVHAGQRHSELLLPMVRELLNDAGIALRSLDGLAFGAGPGSFTGVRIACGVAQGLGCGAGLKVAAVSTLAALAQSSGAARVIAALDARMGEIYHAAYDRTNGAWSVAVAPNLCAPEAAPPVCGVSWTGAGNGFAAYAGALQRRYSGQLNDVAAQAYPHAEHIVALALEQFARGQVTHAAAAAPFYLRDKVALTEAERG
jgi:tRNA threonylcarbamoyladenosine biosynthesis protein TsaB